MPELPEVEALRIGLEKVLVNNTFLDVQIKNKKIISGNGTKRIPNLKKGKEFIGGILNKKIESVTRRAKNIVITFIDKSVILIHLKMTGQLVFEKNKNKINADENKNIKNLQKHLIAGGHPIEESYKQNLPHKHTHIIFNLKNGVLYYNDVRQFGYVLYYKNIDIAIQEKHFLKLGLEPFDKKFTLDYFTENILKKNKNIKSVLLEQSVVVGCGNIYADEICFASNVLPTRNCKTLTENENKLLYKNIKSILKKAIDMGGSSISDYLLADGSRGNYARLHKVYGKNNTPCPICKNNLQKIIISGRATVFCDTCQK